MITKYINNIFICLLDELEYNNKILYNTSKELFIPPMASFCVKAMIRCLIK